MSDALRLELDKAVITPGVLAKLDELGVPASFVLDLIYESAIGAARVTVSFGPARNTYEPEGPDPRLLLAVLEFGELVDLVACASHDPDQWALRRGEGWCLGHHCWEAAQRAALEERPAKLRLFSTPIDWLRGAGAGICVLDWTPAALGHLRALGERVTLQVDAGAGARMRALLEFGGLPMVKERAPVLRPSERKAA